MAFQTHSSSQIKKNFRKRQGINFGGPGVLGKTELLEFYNETFLTYYYEKKKNSIILEERGKFFFQIAQILNQWVKGAFTYFKK